MKSGSKSRNSKLLIGSSTNNRFNPIGGHAKTPHSRNQYFGQQQPANYTYDGLVMERGRNPNMLNMSYNSSLFAANLMSLASLRDEEKYTKDGFIIASIYWTKNFVLEDDQRYINPKME